MTLQEMEQFHDITIRDGKSHDINEDGTVPWHYMIIMGNPMTLQEMERFHDITRDGKSHDINGDGTVPWHYMIWEIP